MRRGKDDEKNLGLEYLLRRGMSIVDICVNLCGWCQCRGHLESNCDCLNFSSTRRYVKTVSMKCHIIMLS